MLQLLVQLERAVQETRARARGAKAFDCLNGCLVHPWVGGQAEVVIGAAHDQAVPLENRLGPLALGHRDEVGIGPVRDGLFRFGIAVALFKDVHWILSLAVFCAAPGRAAYRRLDRWHSLPGRSDDNTGSPPSPAG